MSRLIAAVERMFKDHNAEFPKANTYEWWTAYYAELRAALNEAKAELAARPSPKEDET